MYLSTKLTRGFFVSRQPIRLYETQNTVRTITASTTRRHQHPEGETTDGRTVVLRALIFSYQHSSAPKDNPLNVSYVNCQWEECGLSKDKEGKESRSLTPTVTAGLEYLKAENRILPRGRAVNVFHLYCHWVQPSSQILYTKLQKTQVWDDTVPSLSKQPIPRCTTTFM